MSTQTLFGRLAQRTGAIVRRTMRCSFCGKDESAVARLVSGPQVYICDQCVDRAASVIAEYNASLH